GENRAHKSRHDVELGYGGGVVTGMGADLERHIGAVRDIAIMRKRRLEDLSESTEGRARRDRIGGGGDNKHRWLVTATYRAFKSGRQLDGKQYRARGKQLIDFGLAVRQVGDAEIFRVLDRSQDGAREVTRFLHQHSGR